MGCGSAVVLNVLGAVFTYADAALRLSQGGHVRRSVPGRAKPYNAITAARACCQPDDRSKLPLCARAPLAHSAHRGPTCSTLFMKQVLPKLW